MVAESLGQSTMQKHSQPKSSAFQRVAKKIYVRRFYSQHLDEIYGEYEGLENDSKATNRPRNRKPKER